MKTLLIAGLGNPGKEYEKTRHNAGFLFVDFFREKFRDAFDFSDWEFKKNLNAEISVGKTKNKKLNISPIGKLFNFSGSADESSKIILLKPQTFMNLSGEAVAAAAKYHKVKLEDIVVAHDEIDLPLSEHRFSTDSSSAGHKGVQNILDRLGTKDFTRLRLGVDAWTAKGVPTEKYVLGKFTATEQKKLQKILGISSEELVGKIFQ